MVQSESLLHLPTSQELPCSDETPVDNELQYLIPYLLLAILEFLWAERDDWFFSADMAIHYLYKQKRQTPIVPDAFLSLGVTRDVGKTGRLSYVLWEEKQISPLLVIEIVSKTYNQEYSKKKEKYAQLGVLYYLIYNPDYWQRDKHQPFELYRLDQGEYILQEGEPYWMPEIGLGIGRKTLRYGRLNREWLLWYNQEGNPHPLPQELVDQAERKYERERQLRLQQQQIAQQERQRAEREKQRAEREEQRAEREKQLRLEQLRQIVTQLFSTGFSKEQIANICNLSLAEVEALLEQH